MAAFFDLLFHPLSNGIMTVLTGITALYWIFTFVAGDFLNDWDFSPEFEAETAIDTDTESGVDVNDGGGEKSLISKGLEFLYVGKVPFMVVYSTFKFIAWIITLVSSVLFGLASWGWMSVLVLIPIFIVTFFITRVAAKPLVKVYHAMGYTGEEKHDLLGRVAKMKSSIVGDKIGSAELVINRDVIRIQVQSRSGEALRYHSDVMIVDESKDKRYYLVVPEVNLGNIA